jgi:hypothetical protein
VNHLLQTLPPEIFQKISHYLQTHYTPDQILTEMNAYLLLNPFYFQAGLTPGEFEILVQTTHRLQEIYKNYPVIENSRQKF